MPRLYEATRVPSVVARGIRKSPWACSPLTVSGPARPMGIWATPDEVLDVALGDRGIERLLVEVVRLGPRKRRQKLSALADDLVGVVVFFVVGDRDPLFPVLADRVFDREREPPERVGLDIDGERVLADFERSAVPEHRHDLGERELDRVIRRDLCRCRQAVAPEIEDDVIQGDGFIIDPDLVDLGQHGIAEPVLEAEADAAAFVLETPEGVELFQNEGRDLHEASSIVRC